MDFIDKKKARELDVNRHRFPIGSVVYYIKRSGIQPYKVSYGIVEENCPSFGCLQLLEPIDTRKINGIKIDDFETPTKWEKLPKDWTWNTELFKITRGTIEGIEKYDIRKPEDILEAYEKGILVKVKDNDPARFEAEIDKRYGWRINRSYRNLPYNPNYISINMLEVYHTYEEAQKVIEEHEAELKRQSELSQYDWSVEKIDETLDFWAYADGINAEEKQKYREWILDLDRVEDVEVRIFKGLQWKYWKNSRWMTIKL